MPKHTPEEKSKIALERVKARAIKRAKTEAKKGILAAFKIPNEPAHKDALVETLKAAKEVMGDISEFAPLISSLREKRNKMIGRLARAEAKRAEALDIANARDLARAQLASAKEEARFAKRELAKAAREKAKEERMEAIAAKREAAKKEREAKKAEKAAAKETAKEAARGKKEAEKQAAKVAKATKASLAAAQSKAEQSKKKVEMEPVVMSPSAAPDLIELVPAPATKKSYLEEEHERFLQHQMDVKDLQAKLDEYTKMVDSKKTSTALKGQKIALNELELQELRDIEARHAARLKEAGLSPKQRYSVKEPEYKILMSINKEYKKELDKLRDVVFDRSGEEFKTFQKLRTDLDAAKRAVGVYVERYGEKGPAPASTPVPAPAPAPAPAPKSLKPKKTVTAVKAGTTAVTALPAADDIYGFATPVKPKVGVTIKAFDDMVEKEAKKLLKKNKSMLPIDAATKAREIIAASYAPMADIYF